MADKGGGIVVLKKEDNNLGLNWLVGDTQTYRKLSGNPIGKIKAKLTRLVHKARYREILKYKKEARCLAPEAPRLRVIYQLPKIYKNRQCPPGRPILCGIDSIFSGVGEYLDCFLQPIVQKSPPYLRDSKHLMNLLDNIPIGDDTILVTTDVKSL